MMLARTWMVLAFGALVLGGCSKSESNRPPPACPAPPEDWLAWVVRTPEGAKAVKEAGPGWVAMYRREYHAALAQFVEAKDDVGTARAHRALGALYRSLAGVHARAVRDYLAARRAADAQVLAGSDAVRATADLIAGDAEAPADGLAKALSEGRDCAAPARTLAGQVRQQVACRPAPSCPADIAPAEDSWARRLAAYLQARCAPVDRVDFGGLKQLARTPAVRARIEAKDEIVVSVEVKLYDPLAWWALAEAHDRAAETLGGGTGFAPYLFSSEASDPAAPARTPARARAVAKAHLDAVQAARQCAPDEAGARLVDELGLGTSLADGAVRRAAAAMLADGECGPALALFRSSMDQAASDRITYRNEPTFLVQLAAAAACMRRLPEAIGALRAVRRGYPETQAVLTAVEQLAVARLMGGSGGLQKSQ